MKRIFTLIALSILVGGSSARAQESAASAALLRKVDSLVAFMDTDVSAEYRIEKRDPGGSTSITVAAMFRRDRTNQFLILILEPVSDKGKGYLKEGDNLWLYDPVGKSFTFTSAKERFQNSSFRNSDFNRFNFSGDYRAVANSREQLGKFSCTVLNLEARNDRVSFPKVKLWISDDGLVRKMEDYSLSGQLMRTTAIPSYQKVGSRWLPLSMVIVDHLKFRSIGGKMEYERTTVTISNPSLNKLPDSTYTKEYLEKVSR
ncbi:MAG: outer membrane lipoprotein-sorting protein [Spirochaetae bacterium HGW-Spirochaetae-3]|jgi:outer membrane lipoprotein-sorting protein|nr:MAG: outer membrane lipoprotein-sorting protein [Spirochaetae bacterium HGW-Spirochaetae-3]